MPASVVTESHELHTSASLDGGRAKAGRIAAQVVAWPLSAPNEGASTHSSAEGSVKLSSGHVGVTPAYTATAFMSAFCAYEAAYLSCDHGLEQFIPLTAEPKLCALVEASETPRRRLGT